MRIDWYQFVCVSIQFEFSSQEHMHASSEKKAFAGHRATPGTRDGCNVVGSDEGTSDGNPDGTRDGTVDGSIVGESELVVDGIRMARTRESQLVHPAPVPRWQPTPWERITDETYKQWLLEAITVDEYNRTSALDRRLLLSHFEQEAEQHVNVAEGVFVLYRGE